MHGTGRDLFRRTRERLGRGNLLTRHNDPCDRLSHRYDIPFPGLHPRQNTARRGLDFDDNLIRFHFQEWLALGYGVSFFLSPSQELASFLGQFEGGHDDTDGHDVSWDGRKEPFSP